MVACSQTTTAPPLSKGSISSSTEISKAGVVTASKRVSVPTGNSERIERRKFSTDRWPTRTPLGVPVEPEV
jgi:hypothetical protein